MGWLGDLLGIGKPARSLDSYVQENIASKRGMYEGGMILKGLPQYPMGKRLRESFDVVKDQVNPMKKGGVVSKPKHKKGSKAAKEHMAKLRKMKK